jgi:hypothetical protein
MRLTMPETGIAVSYKQGAGELVGDSGDEGADLAEEVHGVLVV